MNVHIVSPYTAVDSNVRSSQLSGDVLTPSMSQTGRQSHAATVWNAAEEEALRIAAMVASPSGDGGVNTSISSLITTTAFNRKRFLTLVVGVYMAVMVGVQYAFGIVSNKIKTDAGFKQSEMTTITTVGNCFFAFVFPAGVLFDYAGPRPVLLCAMVFGCLGFSLLAMVFSGALEPSLFVVAMANGFVNWQAGFLECATLLCNLFIFPINKGEVVILQKTFFGLGSTFISLCFDAFFSESENYQGYCIFVACVLFVVISCGMVVTKLPAYKRTIRHDNMMKKSEATDALTGGEGGDQLAKGLLLSAEDRNVIIAQEKISYTMHHNPANSDRRRLNFGVTILLTTLCFCATISFLKAFVHMSAALVQSLTSGALLCLAAFSFMLWPRPLPKFFDFDFLPDLHPPEELMKSSVPSSKARRKQQKVHQKVPLPHPILPPPHKLQHHPQQNTRKSEGGSDAVARRGPRESLGAGGEGGAEYLYDDYEDEEDDTVGASLPTTYDSIAEGNAPPRSSHASPLRASQAFIEQRAKVAGAGMVVPSIPTAFTASIRSPLIWCLWLASFGILGTNFVFANNVTQIYTSLHDGVFDKSSNALNVALIGIGSAIGRVCAGFLEIKFHRRNALKREEQLAYLVKREIRRQELEDELGVDASKRLMEEADAEETAAKILTPVHRRWNSSVIMILPISPAVVAAMCLLTLSVPASAIGIVLLLYSAFVGLYQALLALSVREMFSNDVAQHLNFIMSAGIAATVLLNRIMFGMWYDAAQDSHTTARGREHNSDGGGANLSTSFIYPLIYSGGDNNVTTIPAASSGGGDCAGVDCIRNSMLVLAGVNAVGVIGAIYVVVAWWRVRKQF